MNAELIQGNCLDVLPTIADRTVDLVLCDLPYGTTALRWDSLVDIDALWVQWKRVLRPCSVVVLTAAQPFATTLIMSNQEWFKYELIWVKNRPTNFAHAKNKPMRQHENVLVFSDGASVHASQTDRRMPYYPQVEAIKPVRHTRRDAEYTDAFFARRESHGEFIREATGYPSTILEFATEQSGLHPTAKPVALMEWLVRAYTAPDGVVLDNCMGSGSTGVAAVQAGRRFIGIELEQNYFEIAKTRIEAAEAKKGMFGRFFQL